MSRALGVGRTKLYHFTDEANLPSIRERGLIPAPLLAFQGREHQKGIWLTAERDNSPTDDPAATMLTVELDTYDPCLKYDLEPDSDLWVPHWRIYLGTIPPDRIIGGLIDPLS